MTESTRFQNGSLKRVKNETTPDTWFFRYYEDRDGKRVHRNMKVDRFGNFHFEKTLKKRSVL